MVEEFKNYADKQYDADIQGLATLLVVRLGKLHGLYRTVNEQRAIRTSVSESETIDATIQVEDISAFLRDAVSAIPSSVSAHLRFRWYHNVFLRTPGAGPTPHWKRA